MKYWRTISFLFGLVVAGFFIYPKNAQAATYDYFVDAFVSGNEMGVSELGSQKIVKLINTDLINDCDVFGLNIVDPIISVDQNIKVTRNGSFIATGDTVLFNRYMGGIVNELIECKVQSVRGFMPTPYTIEHVFYQKGDPKITTLILNRDGVYYKTYLSIYCSVTSVDEGRTINVDGLTPQNDAAVQLTSTLYPYNGCKLFLPQLLNYKSFQVESSVTGGGTLIGPDGYYYGVAFVGGGCTTLPPKPQRVFIDMVTPNAGGYYSYTTDELCSVFFQKGAPVAAVPAPLPTPVVVTTPPVPTPQVLGATIFRPISKTLTLTKGGYSYKFNGKTIKINPFGATYRGSIWARSIDFGPDGKIFIFINSGAYKKGQVRIYKVNGSLLKAYNPYGGFATNGLNATAMIESNDLVYLAVATTKAGTTVKTYQITAKGLKTLNSLTASTRSGNILVGFQKLYKNQYGLVTMRKYYPSTLKVWKLDLKSNKFVEDKKISKAKIKI